MRFIILLIAIFSLIVGDELTIKKENRVALVIGNSSYTHMKALKNTANDAMGMKKVLESKGFEVLYLEDGDLRKMAFNVTKFAKKLAKNGGVGFFYYAGHGIEVENRNYLIPVNAEIFEEADVKYTSLDINMLLDKMEDSQNRLNIIVLDACRNNPFKRDRSVSGSGGLAQMNSAKGMYIAFATAAGKVASDGEGDNSPFAKHLMTHINEPNLNLEEVFKKTRASVYTDSNEKQLPWTSSSVIGDFYFSKGTKSKKINNAKLQESKGLKDWFIWGKNTHKVLVDKKSFYSKPNSYSIEALKNIKSTDRGGMTKSYKDAHKYKGKKVLLSGYIKCENIGNAFIWMYASKGKNNKKIKEGDIYFKKNIDWTPFEMILQIPQESTKISFGLNMNGAGKIWIDDVNIKIVADDVEEKADNIFIDNSKKVLSAQEEADLGWKFWQDGKFKESASWDYKAAVRGNKYGQMRTGLHFQRGLGVKKDYIKAIYWHIQAVKNGHEGSLYNLSYIYANGRNGIKRDFTEAYKWSLVRDDYLPSLEENTKLLKDLKRKLSKEKQTTAKINAEKWLNEYKK